MKAGRITWILLVLAILLAWDAIDTWVGSLLGEPASLKTFIMDGIRLLGLVFVLVLLVGILIVAFAIVTGSLWGE
ncbi:MAG TPA: hypothetical protein VMO17_12070 [Terriglobia bacterium]|nr:hypothetical protein [Terriglobia bacterium]